MAKKLRPGKYQVLRMLLQSSPLSTDERYLLMYFDSNDNDIWEYTQEGVTEDLGWGLSKYQKVRRSLVRLGMAETEKLYGKDPETGKKVVKGFKVQVHLHVVIQYLENASKCLKSMSSKSTQLRDTLNKGHYNSNVLDEGDRF